jgi:hypothetical protein
MKRYKEVEMTFFNKQPSEKGFLKLSDICRYSRNLEQKKFMLFKLEKAKIEGFKETEQAIKEIKVEINYLISTLFNRASNANDYYSNKSAANKGLGMRRSQGDLIVCRQRA